MTATSSSSSLMSPAASTSVPTSKPAAAPASSLFSAANSGTVHNWNVTELTNDVGNWGMPFSAYGTGSISGDNENGISEPSCADDVISVAAYASGWVTPTGVTTGGAMASFSLKAARNGFCSFSFTHADSLLKLYKVHSKIH